MAYIDIGQQKLEEKPDLSASELATLIGCSTRTARRIRAAFKEEAAETQSTATRNPKVLVFDIETLPMEVFVWGLYKQHITTDKVIKDWCLLSYSAKWIGKADVFGEILTPDEARNRDDKRICKGIWKLIDEADIIIAHNGIKFDTKKLNARFFLHGMNPPKPFVQIDTLKEARKVMAMSSNKLDYLTKAIGASEKIPTNFDLWKKCCAGDQEALDYMLEYNTGDILALEDLYFAIRPWIKSHPNMGIFSECEDTACPNCASANIEWDGYYYTPAGKYHAFRCSDCGAIGRSRFNTLTTDDMQKLSVSVAR